MEWSDQSLDKCHGARFGWSRIIVEAISNSALETLSTLRQHGFREGKPLATTINELLSKKFKQEKILRASMSLVLPIDVMAFGQLANIESHT
ncbi:hypothetical protein AVEN_128718-1 [Araneus ventricosus]|uniref:Uncharacterized protein n=1 Tax=Araneus ventricosus TaxID=182803 RepID=A0A4Y2QWW4_ARAVE|nr:hypothetical protein AVEN_128718-1 [Araneus ventricosus]